MIQNSTCIICKVIPICFQDMYRMMAQWLIRTGFNAIIILLFPKATICTFYYQDILGNFFLFKDEFLDQNLVIFSGNVSIPMYVLNLTLYLDIKLCFRTEKEKKKLCYFYIKSP